MERTFRISCDEVYTVNKTVVYEVTAESFDEARDRLYDGYGEEWDSDVWDECRDDQTIESIECRECGEDEGYCECGVEDDEEYRVNENDNPNWDASDALTVHDLLDGHSYILADSYTREHMAYVADNCGGILRINRNRVGDGCDSDGDYTVMADLNDGTKSLTSIHLWANDACRFKVIPTDVDPDEVDDEVLAEAIERDREERAHRAVEDRKREEVAAVMELLDV